jgi:hypothetical protein
MIKLMLLLLHLLLLSTSNAAQIPTALSEERIGVTVVLFVKEGRFLSVCGKTNWQRTTIMQSLGSTFILSRMGTLK